MRPIEIVKWAVITAIYLGAIYTLMLWAVEAIPH